VVESIVLSFICQVAKVALSFIRTDKTLKKKLLESYLKAVTSVKSVNVNIQKDIVLAFPLSKSFSSLI